MRLGLFFCMLYSGEVPLNILVFGKIYPTPQKIGQNWGPPLTNGEKSAPSPPVTVAVNIDQRVSPV